jgi:hypothetical protein
MHSLRQCQGARLCLMLLCGALMFQALRWLSHTPRQASAPCVWSQTAETQQIDTWTLVRPAAPVTPAPTGNPAPVMSHGMTRNMDMPGAVGMTIERRITSWRTSTGCQTAQLLPENAEELPGI